MLRNGLLYARRRRTQLHNQALTRAELNDGNTDPASNLNSLDINRGGRITLNEWPWSHRSFDQQDLNGDGVITRDEFRGDAVGTTGRQFQLRPMESECWDQNISQ